MSTLLYILLFLTFSCGKNKKDPETTRDPTFHYRQVPIGGRNLNIKINCYQENPDGTLFVSFKLKGSSAIGTIYHCSVMECLGHGRYVGYFQGNHSCITKRGFESEFTLCRHKEISYRTSTVGRLAEISLSQNEESTTLFCDEQIVRILPPAH